VSDVNDLIDRMERAVAIYARIVEIQKADPVEGVNLDDAAKKMRWAIRDIARKIWMLEK
jgi:hypothetical protein